jgi:hypothetical protein
MDVKEAKATGKDLFGQLQAGVETVKAKAKAKDDAGKVFHDATVAHQEAADSLKQLQAQMNDMLGLVVSDPRFRQG